VKQGQEQSFFTGKILSKEHSYFSSFSFVKENPKKKLDEIPYILPWDLMQGPQGCWRFQDIARNIKGVIQVLYFLLVYGQIWLNLP